jgi:hypothetical protein
MNKWSLWAKSAEEDLAKRKVILLFYKEFEKDKFFKYDRYLKRVMRPIYDLTHHRQKKTGFAVSFERLRRALEKVGWHVRCRTRPCSAPRFSTIRSWLRI